MQTRSKAFTELKARVGTGVALYWLPLGAGGHFVRFNGRVYEAIEARREHRQPLDLYHTALESARRHMTLVREARRSLYPSWRLKNRKVRRPGHDCLPLRHELCNGDIT